MRLSGLFRHRVHPQPAVPGIGEALQHIEVNAVALVEPFQRRPDAAAHRLDDAPVRLVVVLAHDVGGENFRRIFNARGALIAGPCRRDET